MFKFIVILVCMRYIVSQTGDSIIRRSLPILSSTGPGMLAGRKVWMWDVLGCARFIWDEVDIQLKSHTTICCWHVQRHVALHNMSLSSIYSRDAAPIGRWIWAIVDSMEFGAIDFAHWFFPLRGGGGAVGGMLGAFKRDTLIDLEFSSKYTTKPMKAPKFFPASLQRWFYLGPTSQVHRLHVLVNVWQILCIISNMHMVYTYIIIHLYIIHMCYQYVYIVSFMGLNIVLFLNKVLKLEW